MGLFDFLFNEDTTSTSGSDFSNTMTLKEALELETEEALLTEGLRLLDISWKNGRPVAKSQDTVTFLITMLSKDFCKNYKKETLTAKDVFEVLEAKGSAVAAFIVGIIYEHGIGGIMKDDDAASLHYEVATTRGCLLPEVVTYAKAIPKLPREILKTEEECIAAGMLSFFIPEDKVGQRIKNSLSRELEPQEKSILLQISSYLLYFYAEKGYAWSLFSAMLYSNEYKKFVKNGMFHKYFMVAGEDNVEALNRRLYELARLGDSEAIAVIQKLNVPQY